MSICAMEADDLDPLYELYKEVVADGGAVPPVGAQDRPDGDLSSEHTGRARPTRLHGDSLAVRVLSR